MLSRLFITHADFVAQRNITDIGVETVFMGIAVPVGFVGTDRMFVPLAGKHTLPANGLKPVSNAANAGKQIDKTEGIVRVRG